MNKKFQIVLFALVAAFSAIAEEMQTAEQQAMIDGSSAEQKEQLLITDQQITKLAVRLGSIESVQNRPLFYAPGIVTVPPNNDFIVTASQGGLISKLNVSIGDRIEKGEVLAIIHSPDLLALQRQYLSVLSEVDLASKVYKRDKQLFDQGVISRGRYEQATSQHQIALAKVHESRQLLSIAGISEAAIRKLASKYQLSSQLEAYSPSAGVVLDRLVSVGSRINPQEPIYRVANIEELWLEINVPQEQIGQVKLGDIVKIENSSATAVVTLLGLSVNTSNQTVLMRAVINGSSSTIRPGQTVTTLISSSSADGSGFKVPNEALAVHEGKSHIFVRNSQGFKIIPVTVLGKEKFESVIQGEINGAETIAVNGAVALKAIWLGLGSEE